MVVPLTAESLFGTFNYLWNNPTISCTAGKENIDSCRWTSKKKGDINNIGVSKKARLKISA